MLPAVPLQSEDNPAARLDRRWLLGSRRRRESYPPSECTQ